MYCLFRNKIICNFCRDKIICNFIYIYIYIMDLFLYPSLMNEINFSLKKINWMSQYCLLCTRRYYLASMAYYNILNKLHQCKPEESTCLGNLSAIALSSLYQILLLILSQASSTNPQIVIFLLSSLFFFKENIYTLVGKMLMLI